MEKESKREEINFIEKGYAIYSDGYWFDSIYQENETFESLEDFLHTEEWLHDSLISYFEFDEDLTTDEILEELEYIETEEIIKFIEQVNEGDEMNMYYSVNVKMDNTKEYEEETGLDIEEIVSLYEELRDLRCVGNSYEFDCHWDEEDKEKHYKEVEEIEKKLKL